MTLFCRGGQVSGDEYNTLKDEIALLDRKEKQLDQLIRNAGKLPALVVLLVVYFCSVDVEFLIFSVRFSSIS